MVDIKKTMLIDGMVKQAVVNLNSHLLQKGYNLVTIHEYTDIDGTPVFWKSRYELETQHPEKRRKEFRFMRLVDGEYQPKAPDGIKSLYNLHRLHKYKNKDVWLVEGEKCVDCLTDLKVLATTSGGANVFDGYDFDVLRDRKVILWRDNDAAGEAWQAAMIDKLIAIGCMINIVDVEHLDLPVKGDVVDWCLLFEKANSRKPTRQDLEQLLSVGSVFDKHNLPIVKLICAQGIEPLPTKWLWDGYLAKGKLHIFAGQAGTGKTTIAIAFASIISSGSKFPDGSRSPTGSVLIWSGEDSIEDTLVPRLMAANADLSKVHFVGNTIERGEENSFDPANDMPMLMAAASKISDLALLIIDPIVNAVAGDSHKNGEVRRALQPIVEFGLVLGCAVVGITHFSKGGQGKDPVERVTGSLAFAALARIVFATAKIEEGDNNKRIFCRAKSNVGIDNGGFEYDLQQIEVKEGVFSSYVLWGDAVDGSARELLAEPESSVEGKDCADFICELLAGGRQSANDVKNDCLKAGFSDSQIRRARERLKIKPHREGFGKGSTVYWDLPNSSPYLSNTSIDDIGASQKGVTSIASMDLTSKVNQPEPDSGISKNSMEF